MTLQMGLEPLYFSCATDCDLKNLECAVKIKTAGLLKNSFYTLFHVIIANGVSATIMTWLFRDTSVKACQLGGILRQINVQQLVASNFARIEKHQRRIMFKRNYFFFHHCLLSCRCLMLQNQYFSLPKWGHKRPLGGYGPLSPLSRSNGTGWIHSFCF